MLKKAFIGAFCALFVLAASLAAQDTLLHSFAGQPSDGSEPFGSLVCGGKTLYGMTLWGGANNEGTIFKIKKDGTGFALLHSFADDVSNGFYALGTLLLKGKILYGVTMQGGAYDKGVLFKINTNGTGYNLLHSFTGAADGEGPFGSLLLKGNAMYGLVCRGGINGEGVIFKANLDGTGFLVLHHFSTSVGDGARPFGGLIAKGSVLYGMTMRGGVSDLGTVFSYSTK